MVENPVLVLLIIIALILVFLAVFTFLTYILLKLVSDLKKVEKK